MTVCFHELTDVPGDTSNNPIPVCAECGISRSDLVDHMAHWCHDFARPSLYGLSMSTLEEMHQRKHDTEQYGDGHARWDYDLQSQPASGANVSTMMTGHLIDDLKEILADTR